MRKDHAPMFGIALGALSGLLLALGCAGPAPKHEYSIAPGQGHHAGITNAMIVPINESADVPGGLDVADDRIERLLDEYIQSKGISIERPESATYQRAARLAVQRARANSTSGESGSVSADASFEQIVPPLLEELNIEADIVIVPNLAIRSGIADGSRSYKWDGVRRREVGSGNITFTGDFPVASLYVVVYGADGTRIFSGYGGLDTVFKFVKQKEGMVVRDDLFEKERYLRPGICIAFYPYFGEEERC